MMMINPAMRWVENVKVPTFELGKVMDGNDECIERLSARISHLFNNTCICRYPHPNKVVFYNIYEFE